MIVEHYIIYNNIAQKINRIKHDMIKSASKYKFKT